MQRKIHIQILNNNNEQSRDKYELNQILFNFFLHFIDFSIQKIKINIKIK